MKVSELIRLGRSKFPEVAHVKHQLFKHADDGTIVGACALGYALLASGQRDLEKLPLDMYAIRRVILANDEFDCDYAIKELERVEKEAGADA